MLFQHFIIYAICHLSLPRSLHFPVHIILNILSCVREVLMLCLPLVSLSDEGLVLVYKAGLEYQVCADGWSSNLSSITCTQMGLG